MSENPVSNVHLDKTRHGTIFRKSVGSYTVSVDDGEFVTCGISSTLRKVLIYPFADPSSRRPTVDKVVDIKSVDPVAINDQVEFIDQGDGTGMITGVLPRKNQLSRRAAGPIPLEQVIVANVDQVIPVFSATKPKPKWQLLDRYLADCESADLPGLICITKIDLVDDESVREQMRVYESIGYPVIITSAITGDGLEKFKDLLRDRVSVFVGKSGVGKTTLLNAIQPGLGLQVKEISDITGKGKHTTSHLEMYRLEIGGYVVDTPGMREFGLWNSDNIDIAWLFREMRPYLGKCKFGADCSHTHEPDCAVKEAVEAEEISENRYQSFVKLSR